MTAQLTRSPGHLALAGQAIAIACACASANANAQADGGAQRHQATHTQCPLAPGPWAGPDAWLLSTPQHWRRLVRGTPDQALGQAVNWQRQSVLLVFAGQQPTLSHALEIQPTRGTAGTAGANIFSSTRFEAHLLSPAPGQMAAMALSTPCALIVLPKPNSGVARVHWVGLNHSPTLAKAPVAVRPEADPRSSPGEEVKPPPLPQAGGRL